MAHLPKFRAVMVGVPAPTPPELRVMPAPTPPRRGLPAPTMPKPTGPRRGNTYDATPIEAPSHDQPTMGGRGVSQFPPLEDDVDDMTSARIEPPPGLGAPMTKRPVALLMPEVSPTHDRGHGGEDARREQKRSGAARREQERSGNRPFYAGETAMRGDSEPAPHAERAPERSDLKRVPQSDLPPPRDRERDTRESRPIGRPRGSAVPNPRTMMPTQPEREVEEPQLVQRRSDIPQAPGFPRADRAAPPSPGAHERGLAPDPRGQRQRATHDAPPEQPAIHVGIPGARFEASYAQSNYASQHQQHNGYPQHHGHHSSSPPAAMQPGRARVVGPAARAPFSRQEAQPAPRPRVPNLAVQAQPALEKSGRPSNLHRLALFVAGMAAGMVAMVILVKQPSAPKEEPAIAPAASIDRAPRGQVANTQAPVTNQGVATPSVPQNYNPPGYNPYPQGYVPPDTQQPGATQPGSQPAGVAPAGQGYPTQGTAPAAGAAYPYAAQAEPQAAPAANHWAGSTSNSPFAVAAPQAAANPPPVVQAAPQPQRRYVPPPPPQQPRRQAPASEEAPPKAEAPAKADPPIAPNKGAADLMNEGI